MTCDNTIFPPGNRIICNQHLFFILSVTVLAAVLAPTIFSGLIDINLHKSYATSLTPLLTCIEPAETAVDFCRQIEEQILKSTVRIEIESWAVQPGERGYAFDVLVSHATVKDGRYLVTHNHFSNAFAAEINAGETTSYRSVTLSDADGKPLFRGPLSDFEVVWEDVETLVIGHKDQALFSKLGFESADFEVWSALSLKPGMEMAQVDWDGSTTRVEWTTIKAVQVENGVPVLLLDGDIMVGASGGGVFWNGSHVANNWTVRQMLDSSDMVVGSSTKVALNSAVVTGNLVTAFLSAGES